MYSTMPKRGLCDKGEISHWSAPIFFKFSHFSGMEPSFKEQLLYLDMKMLNFNLYRDQNLNPVLLTTQPHSLTFW